jgi:hypothetical protein
MSIVDIAQSAANFRGIQGRVTYAEGFVPLRHFILNGYVGLGQRSVAKALSEPVYIAQSRRDILQARRLRSP